VDLVADAADRDRQAAGGPGAPKPAEVPVASGPSPFAYRPGRVSAADEAENPALAEYNRMLAALAAQDRDHERLEQQRQEGH
jgi:hypothetical protein